MQFIWQKAMEKKFFFAGGKFFFLRASFLLFLILLMPPCEISHVFIFSKIFFHQVLEIFMRLCHFQPKTRDIFHILHTKYPSFSAKIFWTRKSKENLIPFINLSISTPKILYYGTLKLQQCFSTVQQRTLPNINEICWFCSSLMHFLIGEIFATSTR